MEAGDAQLEHNSSKPDRCLRAVLYLATLRGEVQHVPYSSQNPARGGVQSSG
jgi:hypothetical protein